MENNEDKINKVIAAIKYKQLGNSKKARHENLFSYMLWLNEALHESCRELYCYWGGNGFKKQFWFLAETEMQKPYTTLSYVLRDANDDKMYECIRWLCEQLEDKYLDCVIETIQEHKLMEPIRASVDNPIEHDNKLTIQPLMRDEEIKAKLTDELITKLKKQIAIMPQERQYKLLTSYVLRLAECLSRRKSKLNSDDWYDAIRPLIRSIAPDTIEYLIDCVWSDIDLYAYHHPDEKE